MHTGNPAHDELAMYQGQIFFWEDSLPQAFLHMLHISEIVIAWRWVQVEIDMLKPGVVQRREPAKPQRQTYYARRYGQQAYGSGSSLIGSLQVSEQTAAQLLSTVNRARAAGSCEGRGGGGGPRHVLTLFHSKTPHVLQSGAARNIRLLPSSILLICLFAYDYIVVRMCMIGCIKPTGAAVH